MVSIPITGMSLARMIDSPNIAGYIRLYTRFFDSQGNQIGETAPTAATVVVNKDENGNITTAYIVFNVDGPDLEYSYARVRLEISIGRVGWRPLSEDVDIVPPSPSFSLKITLVEQQQQTQ
jgi:hypothetical protein